MNVEVRHNSTDITQYVISTERAHSLCEGTAEGTIEIYLATPRVFSIGDEIILYESGIKKVTLYISSKSANDQTGILTLTCQDSSKWIREFFLSEIHTVAEGQSARYWIQVVLNQTGVNYNFTTAESGAILPETELGMEFAYEVLVRLCQQSGWYFAFDADGTCNIGSLSNSLDSATEFDETTILEIQRNDDSTPLRNKVIIWGAYLANIDSSVFTSQRRHTPWDIDANDERTIVLANQFIRNTTQAYNLSAQLLNEFAKISSVKTVTLAGHHNISVGERVFIESRIYTGVARIYRLEAFTSEAGAVTRITLDAVCPRLFGFWSPDLDNEFIYAGTEANGVWRKKFTTDNWTAYNAGITTQHITDLAVNDGVFVTTTFAGDAYYRHLYLESWQAITKPAVGATAQACTIDTITNEFYVAYNSLNLTTDDGQIASSSIVKYRPDSSVDRVIPVVVSGESNYFVYDLEHNGSDLIVTASKMKGKNLPTSSHGRWNAASDLLLPLGPAEDFDNAIRTNTAAEDFMSQPIILNNVVWAFSNRFVYKIESSGTTTYAITAGYVPATCFGGYIYKEDDTHVHLLCAWYDSGAGTTYIKHLTLDLETEVITPTTTHSVVDYGEYLQSLGGYEQYGVVTLSEDVSGVSTRQFNCIMIDMTTGLKIQDEFFPVTSAPSNGISGNPDPLLGETWWYSGLVCGNKQGKVGIVYPTYTTISDDRTIISAEFVYDFENQTVAVDYYSVDSVSAPGVPLDSFTTQFDIFHTLNRGYPVLLYRTYLRHQKGSSTDHHGQVYFSNLNGTRNSVIFSVSGAVFRTFEGAAVAFQSWGGLSTSPSTSPTLSELGMQFGTLSNFTKGKYAQTYPNTTAGFDTRFTELDDNNESPPAEQVIEDHNIYGGSLRNLSVWVDEINRRFWGDYGSTSIRGFSFEDGLPNLINPPSNSVSGLTVLRVILGFGILVAYTQDGTGDRSLIVWFFEEDVELDMENFLLYGAIDYKVLKLLGDEFQQLDELEMPYRVENTQGLPTVLYCTVDKPEGVEASDIIWSYDNTPFTYTVTDKFFDTETGKVKDVRFMRQDLPVTYTDSDGGTQTHEEGTGIIAYVYETEFGATVLKFIDELARDNDYEAVYNMFVAPDSGTLNHLESTNYILPKQYIGTTVSGSPAKFYLSPPDNDEFVEHSTNLPSSEVTIIKVDDEI